MIVLGMAGHIDHGKTALVKALTGINTDRLPEEKSRGMTTDLGFASMRLTAGGADAGFAGRGVSISDCVEFGLIDVPGHERYIRNMVAGAWALDLALLVVAANDGWMEQTENHARVLAALGPPRVMPVITKIDLIEPSHLVSIIDDVLARASLILGASCLAPAQSVSTVASRGLEALKSALYEEGAEILKKKKRDSESRNPRDAPFLYVDRVFSRAGAGTIVCGTLVGNGFSSGDAVLILPSGIEARVKSMESLEKRVERAEGAVRLALNLSKGKAVPIRGDLVVLPGQKASFDVAAEFIIGVEDLAASTSSPDRKSPVLEKGGELEAAVGSASRIGRIAPLGKKGFYRLLLDEPLALPRRLPLALIRHGGAQVLGRAWVVSSGRTDQALRRKIGSVLRESGIAPGPDAREKLIRALEARTKPVPGSTLRARAEPAAGAPRLSPAAMKAEALLRKL
ncbi:MAG TPA: GTP-binding protein, partial [Rectinemataceae bacterium]